MDIRQKIALFPHSPGVYRYYDAEGNVIYVGKAKDLHKRVAQYFVPVERLTRKTAVMVSKIADAEYTVVESEADALLLENNLIKQFKPRYNILLKDSKTYPWICVSAEEFPRVFLTRRVVRDGSRYFGPYSSVVHARNLVEFFHNIYPLRTCKHRITSDVILRGKIRPCLNFHIRKCLGCCVGGISQKEYNENIDEIVRLLRGGGREIIQHYKTLMAEAAANMEFEQAQLYKEKMLSLEQHYSKSVIMNSTVGDVDVFSLIIDGPEAFGNFMRIRGGAVIQSLNLGFKLMIEEEQESVLAMFIGEIQSKFGTLSREIIVPFKPDMELENIEFKVPVRGDKLALLELSARNAKEMRLNALKQQEHTDPDAYKNMVMESLQKQLGMKVLPVHIECFDNSNIQGTNPVSACVVFRNAVPSKKDYRHFKVKTVVGANDYATMKEVVNRRYSRMMEENPEDLPQLIVIDGGKGQLAFAYEALAELGLIDKVTLIALAERMEEVYRVGDPYPMFIDRNSHALKVLQQIRDEAHRFGITFHRKLRSKAQIESALRSIKGVGDKTEQRLLLRFGSVARIASAPLEELAELVGAQLAERIHDALNEEK
ncbi:MAG: excinuclease ABC subunit C [Bacteroidales bacterium]|nr:excinuclease ABC subunit C [Bacteroidales bacterium]MBR5211857.1 excinuclease ABC subunit C [Bacteroidales bacterium]